MGTNNKRSKRDDRRYAKLWTTHFGSYESGHHHRRERGSSPAVPGTEGISSEQHQSRPRLSGSCLVSSVRDGVLNASPMAQVKFLKGQCATGHSVD
jgi:hypothetical protein